MRHLSLLVLALATSMSLFAARPRNVANMHDVDLVYYGSRLRSIAWDKDWARTHVAYTDSTGRTQYLFDTFLLLELHTGTGRFFEPAFRPTHPRNEIGTTKEDWIRILDTMLMVPVRNIDRALDDVAREIGRPKYRRQVVMFIPVPTEGQTNWGEIDGRALDFNSVEDRIAACRWFIDLVRERFKEERFKHLSLAGYYWLAEDKNSGLTMLPTLTDYVRSLGMKTIWIPYFNAPGAAEWREMGFDAAYYQPNYAFPRRVVYRERLYQAVEFAKKHGMFMELEYDMHAVKASNPDPLCDDRLMDYMAVFTETGMADGPIAYYQDEGALYEMKNSPNADDVALYHRFARFVAERQQRLAERK